MQHGAGCMKRRGIGARHERRHDRVEPIAFCLAWAENAHLFASKADHIRHAPSDADVDVALAALRDAGAI